MLKRYPWVTTLSGASESVGYPPRAIELGYQSNPVTDCLAFDMKSGKVLWHNIAPGARGLAVALDAETFVLVSHHSATNTDHFSVRKTDGDVVLPATNLGDYTMSGGLLIDEGILVFGIGGPGITSNVNIRLIDVSGTKHDVNGMSTGILPPTFIGIAVASGKIYACEQRSGGGIVWRRTDFASHTVSTTTLAMSGMTPLLSPLGTHPRYSWEGLCRRSWLHDGTNCYFLASTTTPAQLGVFCYPGAMGASLTSADQLWYAAIAGNSGQRIGENSSCLFAASSNGTSRYLQCFDKSGALLWTESFTDSQTPVALNASEEYVAIQTGSQLRVYAADDGTLMWADDRNGTAIGGLSTSTAVIVGDKLLRLSGALNLACVEAADGAPVWATGSVASTGILSSGPQLRCLSANEKILVMGYNGGTRSFISTQREVIPRRTFIQKSLGDGYVQHPSTFSTTTTTLPLIVVNNGETAAVFFRPASGPSIASGSTILRAELVIAWDSIPGTSINVTPGIENSSSPTLPANLAAYNARTWLNGTAITLGPQGPRKTIIDFADLLQSLVASMPCTTLLIRLTCDAGGTSTAFVASENSAGRLRPAIYLEWI